MPQSLLRAQGDRSFVLTAPGTSALATVRIAGPGVINFLDRRFSRRVTPGRRTHGELRDDDGVIDDPVVVLREDGFAADLTLHGGAWITHCVTTLAGRDGFVRSSVDVETIGSTDAATLFEHELLVSLPLSRTELAACTLLAQPAAWEAFIASNPDASAIDAVLADRSLEYLLRPPTIAIIGVPNAGKSTLANQLFGQQRSIVSPVAGTTRDWVGEEANLRGLIVRLIDAPGTRFTDDPIERAAIKASSPIVAAADVQLVLLDGSHPTIDPFEMLKSLRDWRRPVVVVNKSDVLDPYWRKSGWIEQHVSALISARDGDGIDRLVDTLHEKLGIDSRTTKPRVWTRRQRELLGGGNLRDLLL